MAIAILGLLGCREPSRPPAAATEPLGWPAVDEPFAIAAAATRGFELGVPEAVAISPDGAVVFRRTPARDPAAELYQLDRAGKATVIASAAQLLGGTASGGITAVDVSADGRRLLVSLGPLGDRVFVIDAGSPRELAVGAGAVIDPRLSPDGSRVAFARDGDLWTIAAGDAKPTRLTQHPPEHTYGVAELVAHDLGRDRGHWWSPDGQWLVFQRTDARAVETISIADPRHPERPVVALRYPRAGKANAIVDLGIVSVRGGAPRWVTWDLARYPYLARVVWPAKGPLSLIVLDRAQTELAVLAADPATGATRSLLVEKDARWIDVAPGGLTWLPDGSGFLWMTEAGGAWSLEHHAADGSHVRQVVAPAVGLRRVAGLSADGRDVIIEAAADPREQHVWRVPVAGGDPVALTRDGGVHRAFVERGAIVIRSANRSGGTTVAVIRDDGSRAELPSVAERPAVVPTTVIEDVKVEDHTQLSAVTRPRNFDPKVRYPVLLVADAGPRTNVVLDARDTYLADQWYADAGFIVVRTDGRGTPGRDRDWARIVSTDLITIPMNDQMGALKRLGASHPELDVARTGVLGERFGGYFATMAVLLHPEVFAAAAATEPIIDWELFDTAFTERYLKTPAGNADGYRRTSALTYADRLSRPLLVIHELTDPRIHLAHTLALVEALSASGKVATIAMVPVSDDPARTVALDRMRLEFFRTHLGPPVRPAVMPVARSEEEEEEEERRERSGKKRGDKDRDKEVDEH